MKKKFERSWEHYFRFWSSFFGIRLLKTIWSADSAFFDSYQDDEDDLDDNLFLLTENMAVQFTGDVVPMEFLPEKKPKKSKRKLA